jgi:hypothetical protein
MTRLVLPSLALFMLSAAFVHAETMPSVEAVVKRDVLIVKCSTEIKDGIVNYRVLESWKGKYRSELFVVKPKDGYLYARGLDAKGLTTAKEGQEVIFFYSDNAVAGDAENKGKIRAHSPDLGLAVCDGKVTWEQGEFDAKIYTVKELKKAVLAAGR